MDREGERSAVNEEETRTYGRQGELWAEYKRECAAGKGMYGVVYKVYHPGKDRYFAIKKFHIAGNPGKNENEGVSLSSCREIMLLRELQHQNVCRLEEIVLDPNEETLSLVMDYAEYDLDVVIKHHKLTQQPLPEPSIKSLMWQMLKGVEYLHSSWVMHRDLKPQNILLMGQGPELGVVKIADFGLARLFKSPLRRLHDDGEVVTIWYRAPELLLGARHYTSAVDMWAIGCIFGELIRLKPLFGGKDVPEQLERIFHMLGTPTVDAWPQGAELPLWENTVALARQQYPSSLHKQLNMAPNSPAFKLLSRMLEYDPEKRITARQALADPYFATAQSDNAFDTFLNQKRPLPYPKRSDRAEDKRQAAAAPGGSAAGGGRRHAASSTSSASASMGVGVKRKHG